MKKDETQAALMTSAETQAYISQARDVIIAMLVHPSSKYTQKDAEDWLAVDIQSQCSICRRRHRSDDRHPTE
jgi:hypothetical protein